MDPRTFRSGAHRAAPFTLVLTLLCLFGGIGTAASADSLQAWRKRLDAIALIQWSAFPKSACGDAAPLRTVLERESAIKRSGAERQARGFDQLKTVP